MDVIPVLDVKGGRAVHARRGERAAYARVAGVLGTGDDPLALAMAFRDRLGCRTLYLADLDAIASAASPSNRTLPLAPCASLVRALAALGLEIWVDAGVRSSAQAAALLEAGAVRVVVGLETLPGMDALAGIIAHGGPARTAFSLDLQGEVPLAADPRLAAMDPSAVAEAAVAVGADTLIVLDLARVGASGGPTLPLLRRLRLRLPDARLVAGGGVRDVADLEALADAGCAAALVATALHEGRVGRAEIDRVRTTGSPG
jgi:phosphoribosylformimino-5-aminoimidazole carboxamide ribotide isomerase